MEEQATRPASEDHRQPDQWPPLSRTLATDVVQAALDSPPTTLLVDALSRVSPESLDGETRVDLIQAGATHPVVGLGAAAARAGLGGRCDGGHRPRR